MRYRVGITATYIVELDVDASSVKQARAKARLDARERHPAAEEFEVLSVIEHAPAPRPNLDDPEVREALQRRATAKLKECFKDGGGCDGD